MIDPYIDSKNIGDFTLFIKNPSPGYLYGIRYVDISIDEYICDVKDTISSHNIKYVSVKYYNYICSFTTKLSGIFSNFNFDVQKVEELKEYIVSNLLINVYKVTLTRRCIL
jgi:hypothetical protein